MTPVLAGFGLVAAVLLGAAAVLALVRIVRGPTILDRMIASDVLYTVLLLALGAEMVIDEHTRTVPIMLVIAATATLSTIAVARYVSQQDGAGAGDRDAAEETRAQARRKGRR